MPKKIVEDTPTSYNSSHLVFNGGQYAVVGITSIGDFMAMTGIGREYISAGARNEETMAFLLTQERGKLFYQPKDNKYEFLPLPERQIRYPSAKAKRETLAREHREHEETMAQYRQKRLDANETVRLESIERVASKLYEFDRHNLSWDEAEERTRALYRGRAVEVIALV